MNWPLKSTGKLPILLVGVLYGVAPTVVAQEPRITEAFNEYVATAERRITAERNSTFLRMESMAPEEKARLAGRLKQGEVAIEKEGSGTNEISGGLIHDWIGTVLIPNATVAQVTLWCEITTTPPITTPQM